MIPDDYDLRIPNFGFLFFVYFNACTISGEVGMIRDLELE
jgi:hypothetical protein